jgi:hypothetical protein
MACAYPVNVRPWFMTDDRQRALASLEDESLYGALFVHNDGNCVMHGVCTNVRVAALTARQRRAPGVWLTWLIQSVELTFRAPICIWKFNKCCKSTLVEGLRAGMAMRLSDKPAQATMEEEKEVGAEYRRKPG